MSLVFIMSSTICMQGLPVFENYRVIARVGSGSTAEVFCAVHCVSQSKVAIKRIKKANLTSEYLARARSEVEILRKLNCPFCADIYETFEDNEYFDIVMEYAENGSLYDRITKYGPLCEIDASNIMCELLFVLYTVHEDGVLHRDLKLENILLDKYNNLRLIDFGMGKVIDTSVAMHQTACGTPDYVAPEVILRQPYSCKADIWSVGVILYVLVTGHLPFHDDNMQKQFHKIISEEVEYPCYLSSECVEFIQLCLQKDKDKRPQITELATLPFLRKSPTYDAILDLFYRYKSQGFKTIETQAIEKTREYLSLDRDLLTEMICDNQLNYPMSLYKGIKDELTTEHLHDWIGCAVVEHPIMIRSHPSCKVFAKPQLHPVVKVRHYATKPARIPPSQPSHEYGSTSGSSDDQKKVSTLCKAFNPVLRPIIPRMRRYIRYTTPQSLSPPKVMTC